MKKFLSNILFAAAITVTAFTSVLYVSCSKTPELSPYSCDNHICQHGGYCSLGTCICPVGYEGASCETRWNAKYEGKWSVSETVAGSNYATTIGRQSNYTSTIDTGATPSTILISNFLGKPEFIHVIGLVDHTNSSNFAIQLFTPTNNGNFHITGGTGSINAEHNSISGVYYLNYRNDAARIQYDTVSYTMTRQ